MSSDRKARNVVAGLVALVLVGGIFACGLPSQVQYQCTSDAADTVSLQDTVTATCDKQ